MGGRCFREMEVWTSGSESVEDVPDVGGKCIQDIRKLPLTQILTPTCTKVMQLHIEGNCNVDGRRISKLALIMKDDLYLLCRGLCIRSNALCACAGSSVVAGHS